MTSVVARQSGLQSAGASELPSYEAPSFPMNQAAQRALSTYTRGSKLTALDKRLEEAQDLLTKSAADLNDRLIVRENPLKKRKANTPPGTQDGDDASAEHSVEAKVADLRTRVDKMTQRLDDNMRALIDARQRVKFVTTSMSTTADDARENASTQISTQHGSSQRHPRGTGRNAEEVSEEEDGGDAPPATEEIPDFEPTDPAGNAPDIRAPIDVLRESLKKERLKYESSSYTTRYAENDTYLKFRSIVHDARHPEDDVQLPPASQWFGENGEQLVSVIRSQAGDDGHADADEDDDDIVVDRAVVSMKCPLTLQEFKVPLSSRVCRHSFEKSAILEMIRMSTVHAPPKAGQRTGSKAVQCPVPGCDAQLTMNDLYTDPVLLRRLERSKRTQGSGGSDADAEELIDDDDDAMEVV